MSELTSLTLKAALAGLLTGFPVVWAEQHAVLRA